MNEERNQYQISRKDAKNSFVESLSDAFSIGKVHFNFASYDLNKPAGQRQTGMVSIYIDVDEFLELCRKLTCGELRYLVQSQKSAASPKTALYQSLGGTSADKLKQQNRSRSDGKSLSRTLQVLTGNKSDLILVADSGPGETTEKGLIVPKFGNKPENHITVSMSLDNFGELLLITKTHYEAWLSAWYTQRITNPPPVQQTPPKPKNSEPPKAPAQAVPNEFF